MPVIYLVGATNRKENSKRRKFVKFNGVQIIMYYFSMQFVMHVLFEYLG